MGGFAPIEVDFEPLPDGVLGFEFIDATEWSEPGRDDVRVTPQELSECVQAAGHGVLAALVGETLYGWPRVPEAPFELVGLRSDESLAEYGQGTIGSRESATDPRTLAAAVRRGHPLLGEEGRPPIAVAVLLRWAKYHMVDSAPLFFRTAGSRAVSEALRRVGALPSLPDPDAPARGLRPTVLPHCRVPSGGRGDAAGGCGPGRSGPGAAGAAATV